MALNLKKNQNDDWRTKLGITGTASHLPFDKFSSTSGSNTAGTVKTENPTKASTGSATSGTSVSPTVTVPGAAANQYKTQYLDALSSGGSDDYYTLALEALAQQNVPTYKAGIYDSKYGSQIDAMLNDILASSYEGYNPATDPTYGAYKKQYLREADRTTEDVLGQYAALTGGMPSTAAVSAAAQAGNYYKGQLADKIPELEQLAYQRYLSELEGKRANLSDLLSLEGFNYDLWSDGEDRKLTEYEVNNSAAQDYLNQLVTAAELEQNKNSYDLDALYQAAQLRQSEIDSEYNRSLAENETAYNRAMNLISSGLMPSDADLAKAGIDSKTAQALVEAGTAGSGLSEDAMLKLLELGIENGTTPTDAVLDYFGLTDNWASGVTTNSVARENGTDQQVNFGGTIASASGYADAVEYANDMGVTDTSDLMTEETWSKNKGGYASYDKYVTDYVAKKLESGGSKTVGSPRGHLIGH